MDFSFIIHDTEQLGSYFTNPAGASVMDPAGAIADFSIFVTTQWLPLLKIKYDSFVQIYGAGTSDSTAELRKQVSLNMSCA